MNVNGTPYRSIWPAADGRAVEIIDQTRLPHEFVVRRLESLDEAAEAISVMRVRGAPLIGATAAYGLALALAEDPSDAMLRHACARLIATRPTGANLQWALDRMRPVLLQRTTDQRFAAAWRMAGTICDEDVAINEAIGEHGLAVLQELWRNRERPEEPLRILTHCNAGWIATVDWGTALAPIYKAHDAGLPVHVWVDETRPRNQGSALTAWELAAHGVPFDVIVDNAGGHLMQHGQVDVVITGTDRTTRRGDVCNKIGTYLKALAARDNGVPFYVGLPGPTIDWSISDGLAEVPIEERDPGEVTHITGRDPHGALTAVQLTPDGARARNFAFDVTPARLVTGLITERGVCPASAEGLLELYPEQGRASA